MTSRRGPSGRWRPTLGALAVGAMAAAALAVGPAGADGILANAAYVVSFDQSGGPPNADVFVTDISPNGRFVVFESAASDLVPGDTGGHVDVFVIDRLFGTTERVSVSSSEAQANDFSGTGTISDDGTRVAFVSAADNLVSGDGNDQWDVFVRYRTSGITARLSTTAVGGEVAGQSRVPRLSGNGWWLAFSSSANGLVPGEIGGDTDVFVKSLLDGSIELVSQSTLGAHGNGESDYASISTDGRYISFSSAASNLIVAADTNGTRDVFLRDRTMDTTERVSLGPAGAQSDGPVFGNSAVSDDGRFVAFDSEASDLTTGETADVHIDVYVRDRGTSSTQIVSVNSSEVKGNGHSTGPSMSSDGDRIAFGTNAPNLGGAGGSIIAVRDRSAGTTNLFTTNPDGSSGGLYPKLSGDGRTLAWNSDKDQQDNAMVRILAGATFPDVPSSHPFFEAVSWLVDTDLTTGYADGTYKPGFTLTRQTTAAFLYRDAGEPVFFPPLGPTFSDVPTDHPFFKEIEWAAAEGIVTGLPDGTFAPGTVVTRAAVAAFLYRAAGSPAFMPPGTPTFSDVPTNHAFYDEIEWAAARGIVTGFANGTYQPGGAVTRQSMAAYLFRAEWAGV